MIFPLNLVAALTVAAAVVASTTADSDFNVKPFKIDLGSKIPRLKFLVENTRLPAQSLYPSVGPEKGVELDFLRELRTEWVTSFDWEAQEAALNVLHHFTAEVEGQTVHFVHERSEDPDAIPLILLHGWPSSFQEFIPVIKPLTEPSSVNGAKVSYHVVVPSLPGFVFSSPPPVNATVDDTARIFNTLMTNILGYATYAAHGTDAGCAVAYSMYGSYNTTVRAAHFTFILAANNITLSEIQKVTEQRYTEWSGTGQGYFIEQTTKPNDMGLALYDNPVGQLAWIGGLFKLWSDPRAGTPPSVLNNTAILTAVSLSFLTESFLSSVWIYAQNPGIFRDTNHYTMAPTDAPLLFSQYEYNVALWPEEYVAKVGNLVSYKVEPPTGGTQG
ncbi:epoxide hydrolase 1 [Mycena filopes]|nr:epoxide hydrolase 1 [Mycena filopes]